MQYGKNLKKDDYLIINRDDPHYTKVTQSTKAHIISFGIKENCDYRAEDIHFSEDGYSDFSLNIRGKKNIL